MSKERKEHALEKELIAILFTMEVPLYRLQSKDWAWMNRNLSVRNREHPEYPKARELLSKLLSTVTLSRGEQQAGG